MRDYLERHGVRCVVERHPSGKDFLFASTQPGKVQDFVLSCHLAIVPPSSFTL